jgi:hypothetical protein
MAKATKTENAQSEMVEIKKETEKEFLLRLIHIQHNGGFGKHLDNIINERINSL